MRVRPLFSYEFLHTANVRRKARLVHFPASVSLTLVIARPRYARPRYARHRWRKAHTLNHCHARALARPRQRWCVHARSTRRWNGDWCTLSRRALGPRQEGRPQRRGKLAPPVGRRRAKKKARYPWQRRFRSRRMTTVVRRVAHALPQRHDKQHDAKHDAHGHDDVPHHIVVRHARRRLPPVSCAHRRSYGCGRSPPVFCAADHHRSSARQITTGLLRGRSPPVFCAADHPQITQMYPQVN
jgi:hypothetical protein